MKKIAADFSWIMAIVLCTASIFFAIGTLYAERSAYQCDACAPLVKADPRPYKVRP